MKYKYKCGNCEEHKSIHQSIKDDAVDECPDCGSKDFNRVITGGSGLLFKGPNFYVNQN
jgi:putative FmdB family regulatory protein